jgi:hypothetical protein
MLQHGSCSSSLCREKDTSTKSGPDSLARTTEKGNMANFESIAASAKTRTPVDNNRANVVETESTIVWKIYAITWITVRKISKSIPLQKMF